MKFLSMIKTGKGQFEKLKIIGFQILLFLKIIGF
jgi:hypothetical protein